MILILLIIYGISIPGTFTIYLLSAKKSKTASTRKKLYLLAACLISVIPIINTIILLWTLIEMTMVMPFKENDIVEILHPSLNLPAGSQGTIVYVYKEIGVFEIEFHMKSRPPIVRWARPSEIRLVKPNS